MFSCMHERARIYMCSVFDGIFGCSCGGEPWTRGGGCRQLIRRGTSSDGTWVCRRANGRSWWTSTRSGNRRDGRPTRSWCGSPSRWCSSSPDVRKTRRAARCGIRIVFWFRPGPVRCTTSSRNICWASMYI